MSLQCGMDPERERAALEAFRSKALEDRQIRPPMPRNRPKRRNGTQLEKVCRRCKAGNVLYYRCAQKKDGYDDFCCDCRIAMSLESRRRDMQTVELYRAKQRDWWYGRAHGEKASQ